MKKSNFSVFLALTLAIALLIGTIPVSAASVKISKAKATMEIDSVLTLKISGTEDTVKWTSSKKSIAKVTSKGKVTAVKEGTATITATVNDKKYKCVVTVVDSNKEEIKEEIKKEEKTTVVTLGEQNALRSAKDYLKYMAFSRTGLIKQLEYEGYSKSEAVYGVDNCGADWKEQAVKSAQSYLKYMSFSKSGLISQLEYEGFTEEEAEYGAKGVGY